MNQEFPSYTGDFSDYLGDLRGWVFSKQVQAAAYFGVSHTTIGRYENGKLTPPIQYVIDLVKLVVDRFQAAAPLSPEACQLILQDVNTVIQNIYPGAPFFKSWTDLLAFDHHFPRQAGSPHLAVRMQWSAAPDAAHFYGRTPELHQIHQWAHLERSRLVALLGIGGIGKTTLAAKYGLYAQGYYEDILWISLRNAPLPGEILTECIRFFSNQHQDGRSNDPAEQIALLITLLRRRRCLLVIDNFESVLLEGEHAGSYPSKYSAYGDLIHQFGVSDHQSCVILTSREKPKEIHALESSGAPVRSLVLSGLGPDDARLILGDSAIRINANPDALDRLVTQVSGNPLALQWLPALIDLYGGEIDRLLADGVVISGSIFPLLQQQFQRLTRLEADILFWLAVEREVVSLDQLQELLISAENRTDLLNALFSLRSRSLLESSKDGFLLQNLVMEYVMYLFVSQVSDEILSGKIHYFNSHALYRVQAQEFITQAQRRLIVQPVAQKLLKHDGKLAYLQDRLIGILNGLRRANHAVPGYAGGNVLRLLEHLGVDLTGMDFSDLPLWDLDLRNTPLHQVNLNGCDLSRSAFIEVFGRVLCLTYSPAGDMAAVGTADGEILVLRTADFSLILDIQAHTDWVRALAFDPTGQMLVSASDDSKVKLWDIQTGQCLKSLLGHQGRVMTAVFHPNQPVLASGGEDSSIRLWNIHTGLCEQVIMGHSKWVYALRFTADGSRLVSGSSDETVKVWDLRDTRCLAVLTGHTGPVWTLAISPDDTIIASSGGDLTVRLWRLDTAELIRMLGPVPVGVRSLSFSADGLTLAVPSAEKIYLYTVESGALAALLTGHTSKVWAAHFSPDGSCLASTGFDRTLRFWSTRNRQCLFTLRGYHNAVPSAAFYPHQPGRLVFGCEDGNLRVWDMSLRQYLPGQFQQVQAGHTDWVKRVSFSPDGRFLATAADDSTVRLWDTASGKGLSVYQIRNIGSICFDQTGRLLITASNYEMRIQFWDTATGQETRSLDGRNTEYYWLAVSPDNRVLAAAGEAEVQGDGKIFLWDLPSGEFLGSLTGHQETVWALAFDPGGHYLVSSGADQTLRVWDYRTHSELAVLRGHTDQVKAVVVSPRGDCFASAGQDGMIRIWDAREFSCQHTQTGHDGSITSLSFSPDGQILCSTGMDETLRFWAPETGRALDTLRIIPPYQGMKIAGVTGLNPVQVKKLIDLGAEPARE